MALLYSPPSPHGHFYYEASQLAAFALYVGLLLAQGYRRGYALRSWLPLVAATTLALVLGCQLVFLAPGNWLAWLGGDAELVRAVAGGPRSVVGGAAFSLVAILALRRALGFRGWAVLDAFAGPLCWALAVQSVGCVLVGCCWGEPTAAGTWGLVYGPGTPAYTAQLAQGLLPTGASHALPVVPTQLYHLLLCASTGLALHLLRRRATGWPGGSRYLLAMALLCLGRWGIEFWRDAAGEPLWSAPLALAGHPLPGLGLQWLLLLEATALLGGWAWLVRWGKPLGADVLVPAGGAPAVVGLGLLVTTARLAPGILNLPEILVLQALLLAVLLAEAHTWLRWPGLRLAGLPLGALLAIALVGSTAQAPAPQQAAPIQQQEPPTRTTTFSGGVLSNYHEAEESIWENNSGCSSKQPLLLQQRVRAAGGEVAVTTTYSPTRSSTWGGGIWLGEQQVAIQTLPTSQFRFIARDTTMRYFMSDIHVYREEHFGHDWLSFGVRAGLHVGSLGYFSYFDNGNARSTTFLMPELMLSLGNPRLLYGQADFCYGAENTLGAYTARIGLGSGLGQSSGTKLLVGYAHSPHYPSPSLAFVSASLRLPGSTGLGALSLEPYFATDLAKHTIFSLKASYRLSK